MLIDLLESSKTIGLCPMGKCTKHIIRRNATSEDTDRLSRVDAYDLGCTVQSGQSRCGATKLFNIIPVLAIP